MANEKSIAVIGAGIIGAAAARELQKRHPDTRVVLWEKESGPARHQSGHNSGVIHAGLYYEPGSLKATLTRRGVGLLKDFAAAHDVPIDVCGKVVVAAEDAELDRLRGIYERACANGVPDVRLVDAAELRDIEPNVVGRAAVYSPHTAIVDYRRVTEALIADFERVGGTVRFGSEVVRVEQLSGSRPGVVVHTRDDAEPFTAALVCGGLQADRLAERSAAGGPASPRVVPFFGQYMRLEARFNSAVRGLVYPVPDPRYPFLGVHITRKIDGSVTIGPNAFLAFAREGYRGYSVSLRDCASTAAFPGFWRFAAQNMPAALRELGGVLSTRKFIAGAARFVPDIADAKVTRLERGVRAQALNPDGSLVDDFVIDRRGSALFVRNAPSPGATSSLAIAEHLADECRRIIGD